MQYWNYKDRSHLQKALKELGLYLLENGDTDSLEHLGHLTSEEKELPLYILHSPSVAQSLALSMLPCYEGPEKECR